MAQVPSAPNRGHIAYFDYLRIAAACCVILLHVSAQNWNNVSVESSAWMIFNFANSFTRWAVPVFFMISGAIYLDNQKPLDMHKLWHVRIFRLFTVFVFWSGLYALDMLSRGHSLEASISSFIGGKYHMWYLPALAGLYIVLPLIRKITESRHLTRYYLAVSYCFVILLPQALNLLKCMDVSFLAVYLHEAEKVLSNFDFSFGQIGLFYFVLGYYLTSETAPVFSNQTCLLMIICGYLTTALLNGWYAISTGTAVTTFYGQSTLNVLCMSTGVFCLARNTFSQISSSVRISRIVRILSQCTFGIYLIHPLVLERLEYYGLNTLTIHPILAVPSITLLVLLISCILILLLRRIPLFKTHLL